MNAPQSSSDPDFHRPPGHEATEAQLTAGLKRLASDGGKTGWHLGWRFRNAFFTGLVIVGPVTITLWIMWGVIHWIDAWIKPLLPNSFNPDTYLPFPVPGLGLVVAVVGLTLIGALAANLFGRTLVSSGELHDVAYADSSQCLRRHQANLRKRDLDGRSEPELPEGRNDRVPVERHLESRICDGRDDG